jgi:hypothetical protein
MKECKIKEYQMKDSTQMMKDSTRILLNQHL